MGTMAPTRTRLAAALAAAVSLEGKEPPVASHEEEQAESKSELPTQKFPCLVKKLSVISLIIMPAFTFFTPLWSYLLNDVLDATSSIYGPGKLCNTKATLFRCGDSGTTSYVTQLQEFGLENRKIDGEFFACGCARGWLADWVCPVASAVFLPDVFTLSYFVSTSVGTGAMAAVSFWPIITMWAYGLATKEVWMSVMEGTNKTVDVSSCGLRIVSASILFFQVCYGLFLIATNCIAPTFHTVVVVLFVVAMIVYFLTLALVSYINAGTATKMSKVILAFALVGLTALALGFAVPPEPFGRAGLFFVWFGEVVGLNCALGVSPVLVLLSP